MGFKTDIFLVILKNLNFRLFSVAILDFTKIAQSASKVNLANIRLKTPEDVNQPKNHTFMGLNCNILNVLGQKPEFPPDNGCKITNRLYLNNRCR